MPSHFPFQKLQEVTCGQPLAFLVWLTGTRIYNKDFVIQTLDCALWLLIAAFYHLAFVLAITAASTLMSWSIFQGNSQCAHVASFSFPFWEPGISGNPYQVTGWPQRWQNITLVTTHNKEYTKVWKSNSWLQPSTRKIQQSQRSVIIKLPHLPQYNTSTVQFGFQIIHTEQQQESSLAGG